MANGGSTYTATSLVKRVLPVFIVVGLVKTA
jgi:hypothetical protein